MKGLFLTICLILATLSSGCISAQQSTGVGSVAGGGLGAGIGMAFGNPALGALIGAGVGALGGALAQDHLEKKRMKKETEELEKQLMEGREAQAKASPDKASASGGKTFVEGHYEYEMKKKWVDTSKKERVWVEEKMEGERRVEGHYEERVVPSGYWDVYEEKVWVPDHYE